MAYTDLPSGWTALPLTDPTLAADVVDLVLPMSARATASLLLQPTDEHGVGLPTPIVIDGMPWVASERERRRAFSLLLEVSARGVIVATSRHWGRVTPHDASWRASAERILPELGIDLHGFFVATRGGVFPVPSALATTG